MWRGERFFFEGASIAVSVAVKCYLPLATAPCIFVEKRYRHVVSYTPYVRETVNTFIRNRKEGRREMERMGFLTIFFFLFFFNAKGEMERLVKIVNCERNCWTFFSRNDRGFSWFENYLNFFLNVNHLFNPFKPNPRVVVCVVLFFELEFSSLG